MNNREYSFELAPVIIHTYTRLEHLQKTIEALRSNELANLTDLYIASDAPRDEKDAHDVRLVREYIQSIEGFKSVTAILRERNLGGHNNAVLAFDAIFKKTDRLIAIEDDTIVGKGFISYINQGLSLYAGDRDVFAICGYLDPCIVVNTSAEAVLLPGFSGWGYGIWRDRFYEVPDYVEIANEYLKSPRLLFKLNMNRPDFLFGLKRVADGLVAADFAFALHMIKTNKKCLFPTKSLVRNIGHDGSGINCMVDYSYGSQPFNQYEILNIGSEKASHSYPVNPLFPSFGGWRALITNVLKFSLFMGLGNHIYGKMTNLKYFYNRYK